MLFDIGTVLKVKHPAKKAKPPPPKKTNKKQGGGKNKKAAKGNNKVSDDKCNQASTSQTPDSKAVRRYSMELKAKAEL